MFEGVDGKGLVVSIYALIEVLWLVVRVVKEVSSVLEGGTRVYLKLISCLMYVIID